jgi:hypothetical protein
MQWLPLSQIDELELSDEKRNELKSWKVRDGAIYFSGGRKLRNANLAAFEFVNDESSFVARDDRHVFFASILQKSIDRDTFEPIGDRYYRDSKLAYFEYETSLRPLKGMESECFRALGCGYARDSSFGYFWGKPLRKCESPMALNVIKADDDQQPDVMDYAMDDEFVYCEAAALPGADLGSWQPRGCGYSIDKNNVFFFASRVAKVDVQSWQHIEGYYSRDEKHVYDMGRRLKGASPDRWRILEQSYSTDGEFVYFCDRLVKGADAKSFQVSSEGEARDLHGAFDRGDRVKDS